MLRRSRDISIRTTWKGIGACGCKDDGLNCPGLFAALDIFVGEETVVQLNVIEDGGDRFTFLNLETTDHFPPTM
jgi:hypothetical protein